MAVTSSSITASEPRLAPRCGGRRGLAAWSGEPTIVEPYPGVLGTNAHDETIGHGVVGSGSWARLLGLGRV